MRTQTCTWHAENAGEVAGKIGTVGDEVVVKSYGAKEAYKLVQKDLFALTDPSLRCRLFMSFDPHP